MNASEDRLPLRKRQAGYPKMSKHNEGLKSNIDQTKTKCGLCKIRTGSDSDQPKAQLTKELRPKLF